MIAGLLVGCTATPDADPDRGPLLARISLDVRGVRPSADELDTVERDPDALPDRVDQFLADPRFEGRLVEYWQLLLRTRSERYLVFDRLSLADPEAFVRAVGEEPIRLAARLSVDDEPYSALVTADRTMVNEDLAAVWPTDYPADGVGWQEARYTDGRPAAGVLGTNGLWWRYSSTRSNANRKRANQVSRVFACSDFLDVEIPFDPSIDLLDQDAIAHAITTNPSCTACHAQLDPIASHFYGFWYFYDDGFHLADASVYHPELEQKWRDVTGVAPGWYGHPDQGLVGLPAALVSDPRFVPCAVTQVFRFLVGRDPDEDELAREVDAFGAGGFTVRAAWRSVLTDPAYAAVPHKIPTPDLVADEVQDLTGFRWTLGSGDDPGDALTSDARGVLTLAGGADGTIVTEPLHTPSSTARLVQDRLAMAAAVWAVGSEPDRKRLLPLVDGTEPPSDPIVARQLRDLHRVLLGRRVGLDGPEVEADRQLLSEVLTLTGRGDQAWAAVIAALLRDPDFATY